MKDLVKQTEGDQPQGESLVRGGLGLLAGLVVCGVAIAAQAALLQAIAGGAKKAA